MKKLLIVFVCLAIFCALCACGEVEPQANASNEPTPPSAAPSGAGAPVEPGEDASVEPSADASNDPSAAPSGDASVEPSTEVSSEPSDEPSAPPTATPTLPPVQHFADLGDYGIVEDENTEYPIIIKTHYTVNMSDAAVELAKQFVGLLTGEPLDAVRAMRFENVRVAEATINGDEVAVYTIAVSLAMRDGLEPNGDLWEGDYSFGIDDNGWYYNTYAAYKPCMLAVTLNGELFCAADGDLLWQEYEAQYSWHSAEDAEKLLRAVYEEYIADDPQGGYAFELSPDWVTHRLLYGGTIEVLDADGNDVTDEFYELWQAAESAYGGGFENGDWVTGIYEAIPMICGIEQFGVEETLDEIFTENGKAQILDAEVGGLPLLMHRAEDDTWWYPEPRSSGWDTHLLAAETVSASDGRIELLLTYGFRNDTDRRIARFVMVETAGGWKVDDFPTFKYSFGAEHLLYVIDGYDAEFMIYGPSNGYLLVEDARFLGGYWTETESVCTAWLENGILTAELSKDVYNRGQGYSGLGPTVRYTLDIASGAIVECEYYDSADYIRADGNYFGTEFTETELLSWGLMLADVIADAEAEFLAEHGD